MVTFTFDSKGASAKCLTSSFRIGLYPSELQFLPNDALIDFSQRDVAKVRSLLNNPQVQAKPGWRREIELMSQMSKKAEIQALSSISLDYTPRVYLPTKILHGLDAWAESRAADARSASANVYGTSQNRDS